MSQFLEVLEWVDTTGDEIVHREPPVGSGELKFGAQAIVRDSQAAVFVRDGKALDVLGPGRHTLTTLNLPILTKVLALPWGFTSPFRAEVYFVNLKLFTGLRWGTKDPVAFRDRELGLVRLRAFGMYAMRVVEPLLFLNTLVGPRGTFDTAHIEDWLREVIVSRLNDFLGEHVDALVELPSRYDEMSVAVKARLAADFRKYGLELGDLVISHVTPPEDVQRVLDESTQMAAIGDVGRYLQFQTAKAIGAAGGGGAAGGAACGGPGNGGGGNGIAGGVASGLGLGVGAGVGLSLPGMLVESLKRGPSRCSDCHGDVGPQDRFCAHCGHQLVVARRCSRCDKAVVAQARFCPACGLDLAAEQRCGKCQAKVPTGARFCLACGERVRETPPAPAP